MFVFFFFECSGDHRDLHVLTHSCPPRRSSDLLYSPIADWAETLAIITSMLLIVPVWTVLQNFFGTMIGRWHTFGGNLPAKFLIMGALMYLAGCFQRSEEHTSELQSLMRISYAVFCLKTKTQQTTKQQPK